MRWYRWPARILSIEERSEPCLQYSYEVIERKRGRAREFAARWPYYLRYGSCSARRFVPRLMNTEMNLTDGRTSDGGEMPQRGEGESAGPEPL
ncbi:unnamed protein product [Arctogadus glacialis]